MKRKLEDVLDELGEYPVSETKKLKNGMLYTPPEEVDICSSKKCTNLVIMKACLKRSCTNCGAPICRWHCTDIVYFDDGVVYRDMECDQCLGFAELCDAIKKCGFHDNCYIAWDQTRRCAKCDVVACKK
jgi:hypothetical protein